MRHGLGKELVDVKLESQLHISRLLQLRLRLHLLFICFAKVVSHPSYGLLHILGYLVICFLDAGDKPAILLLVLVQVLNLALDVEVGLLEFLLNILALTLTVRQVFGAGHLQGCQLIVDGLEACIWHLCLVQRILNCLHSVLEAVQMLGHFEFNLLLQNVLIVHQRLEDCRNGLAGLRLLHELVNIRLLLPKFELLFSLFVSLFLLSLLFGILLGLNLLERRLYV